MPEYRQVTCPQCGKRLGLPIRQKSSAGVATCLYCGTQFSTAIPSPAETRQGPNDTDLRRLHPLMEEFCEALNDAIVTDPHLQKVIEKIRREGYDAFLILEATLGLGKREGARTMREPTPLVKDGEVVPEAFTPKDVDFMKSLRINFDGEENSKEVRD